MKTSFKWSRSIEAISEDFTGKEVQLFLANEAKKLMDPYVPARSLFLSRNVKVFVENGKGIVHYQSPYARYQYEGKVMVSKRPGVRQSAKVVKQPESTLNYTKFRHPLATSHWDEAMMVAKGSDLIQATENFIRSRK